MNLFVTADYLYEYRLNDTGVNWGLRNIAMCNDCHSDLCMCYVLHALSNYFDFQHPQIEQRPDALEFCKVHFGQLQNPSEVVSDAAFVKSTHTTAADGLLKLLPLFCRLFLGSFLDCGELPLFDRCRFLLLLPPPPLLLVSVVMQNSSSMSDTRRCCSCSHNRIICLLRSLNFLSSFLFLSCTISLKWCIVVAVQMCVVNNSLFMLLPR